MDGFSSRCVIFPPSLVTLASRRGVQPTPPTRSQQTPDGKSPGHRPRDGPCYIRVPHQKGPTHEARRRSPSLPAHRRPIHRAGCHARTHRRGQWQPTQLSPQPNCTPRPSPREDHPGVRLRCRHEYDLIRRSVGFDLLVWPPEHRGSKQQPQPQARQLRQQSVHRRWRAQHEPPTQTRHTQSRSNRRADQ